MSEVGTFRVMSWPFRARPSPEPLPRRPRRTVFPNHTMRRQDEVKSSGQIQIFLVGLKRRSMPLPIQLYYHQTQQQPSQHAAVRPDASEQQAPPPGNPGDP